MPEAGRPAPTNFVISIDGEEHPIHLNNPVVLQLGNRERKIVVALGAVSSTSRSL
jgi:hypothetical protein